jgi:hypothetical protein
MGLLLFVLLVGYVLTLIYRWLTLTDDCYDHVKEHIRGDQHAGHRSMRRQEGTSALSILPRRRTGGLYQPTAITPARSYLHVQLLPSVLFLVAPTRRTIRGARIRWTPLVTYPSTEWLDELANCVAHFLGVAPHEVELAHVNTYRKVARIVRT